MTEIRRCKDCITEKGFATARPAPHPGPRCTTHHRAVRKARSAAAHENRVGKTYGLQPGEYEAIYVAQGGCCAICRRATGRAKRLAVDHDHSTGEVRGLLCSPCNRMIGQLRDDAQAFERAADYLRNPPARRVLQPREEAA